MTFLAPAALLGLSLLALPILIHLLRPRKMPPTPFSSLRWLKIARQRLSRRVQWNQWLLFLMRAWLIVLLVLALGKPVVGLWSTSTPVDRYLIVDSGRTMAYEGKDGQTSLQRAHGIAAELAQHANPGDRTAIILAGEPLKLITAPTADPTTALPKLRAEVAPMAEGRVTSALSILPTLFGPTPPADVELTFLTANQRHTWRQDEIQAFLRQAPEKLHVQVIDVGPGEVSNAWIAGARLIDRGAAEDRRLRVDVGSVGSVTEPRTVRLTGIDGLGNDGREVTLEPGRIVTVDFTIPAAVQLAGQVAEVRLDPRDALPSDDRFFLNFDMAWALRVLLVEPAQNASTGSGPGVYLRTALDSLAASGNHSFRLTDRVAPTVTLADLRDADVVFLAGVPKLSREVVDGIEQRVRGGAGLVVFLGPQIDPLFYRQDFYRPLQPEGSLVPFAPKAPPDTFTSSATDNLTQIQWDHPLLAPLRDPLLSDLSRCQFLKHANFDGAANRADTVLAYFGDGCPALVERPLGAGRTLLWNTTADDVWSDLPRRRCFVPLVDRMLTYLSAGGVRRQFLTGAPINLPVPRMQAGEIAVVTTPGGARQPIRLNAIGTQTILHLDSVAEPGIYRVETPHEASDSWAFVVNTDRMGSPMTAMDPQTLERWWSPASFAVTAGDAALARIEAESRGWSLWPLLVVLGGGLLFAETIYAYWLCPRKNPTAVTSVVPRRGILKPMSQSAT